MIRQSPLASPSFHAIPSPARAAVAALSLCVGLQAQVQVGTLAPNGMSAQDLAGFSVAQEGNRAVLGNRFADVGAVQDQGSATVFERIGGTWQETATLVASDGAAFDEFGWELTLQGDVIVIGAPEDDDAGFGSGSAYVFVYDGSSWTQTQKLVPTSHSFGDVFGVDLDLDGNRLVVGSCQKTSFDTFGFGTGVVTVFEDQGAGFVEVASLTASDARDGSFFGNSVELEDTTLMIGSEGDDDVAPNAGAAYWFELEGGSWIEKQQFRPGTTVAGDFFARRTALDGTRFVAGAETRTVGGASSAGVAFVFEFDTTSDQWLEAAVLQGPAAVANAHFGASCEVDGDLIVVGAPGPEDVTQTAGSLSVFDASLGYAEVATFVAPATSPGDAFGRSIAADGSVWLASAPASPGGGAAFLYDLRRATSTVRDAGSNPSSLRSGPPVLGTTLDLTVDLSTSGHALAGVVGFLSPLTLQLAGGQTLLVNVADPAGELFGLALAVGPQAQLAIPLPLDASLLGLSPSAQAVHVGAVTPFALSNALDFVVGAL